MPSPAPVFCASCGSRIRQFDGIEPGLGDRSDRAGGGEEIGEADGAAGAKARPVLQPHPRLGDHPENALRADEQAVGAGAGAGAGQAARLDDAARRDDAQAFDEIVDMGVEGGEMAARPGRDPAAQCRILEALRKMPQGQIVRLQLRLERGAEDAGLDARGARGAVDLRDPVEMPQVEGDRRPDSGCRRSSARRRRRRCCRRRTGSPRPGAARPNR